MFERRRLTPALRFAPAGPGFRASERRQSSALAGVRRGACRCRSSWSATLPSAVPARRRWCPLVDAPVAAAGWRPGHHQPGLWPLCDVRGVLADIRADEVGRRAAAARPAQWLSGVRGGVGPRPGRLCWRPIRKSISYFATMACNITAGGAMSNWRCLTPAVSAMAGACRSGPLREPLVSRLATSMPWSATAWLRRIGPSCHALRWTCSPPLPSPGRSDQRSAPEALRQRGRSMPWPASATRIVFRAIGGAGLAFETHPFPDHHRYSPADLAFRRTASC